MDLRDTVDDLAQRRRALDRLLGQRDALISERDRTIAAAEEAESDATHLEQAVMLLNRIADQRAQEAQTLIESIVTRGLQAIFDESVSLVIQTTVKDKTTSTEFLIRTETENEVFETPVIDSRGGGMVAVVGFLLRVTLVLLTQPEDRRLLVLDETFAHVSEEYLPAVSGFLRDLVEETGLQIIMVTHQPELASAADKVYRVSQRDSRTHVKAT